MDKDVQDYIDGIEAEHRPLFDRLHRLILEAQPEAVVAISYKILAYKVGSRRLYIGAWKHGVSLYGWHEGHDAGFVSRHPELLSGKATVQLRPEAAAAIPDEELRDFARAALSS